MTKTKLTCKQGLKPDVVIDVGADPVVVGRDSDCQFVLNDPQASRKHARFERVNGSLVLTDLGSTNGSSINGMPLSGTTVLKDGDSVQIGSSVFSVRLDPGVALRPGNRKNHWIPLGIGSFALIFIVGWLFVKSQQPGLEGVWLEPVLGDFALEFQPNGEFRESSAEDGSAPRLNWASYHGHYFRDGQRVTVEYTPGQGIVGRRSWVITNLTKENLTMDGLDGPLDLKRVSHLPSAPPKDDWGFYDSSGKELSGPDAEKMRSLMEQMKEREQPQHNPAGTPGGESKPPAVDTGDR